MARVVFATIAGYVVLVALSFAAQMMVIVLLGVPAALAFSAGYIAANVGLSLFCGGAGGWLAARIAHQFQVTLAVGVVTLLFGWGGYVFFGATGPFWYSLLLPLAEAAGAAAGGILQRNLSLGAYRWPGRKAASGKSPWISEA